MDTYAIYNFELSPLYAPKEGDLPFFPDSPNKGKDMNQLLNQYLKELTQPNVVEKYSMTTLVQRGSVTMLRLEKPETLTQYAKMPQTGEINQKFLPSYPYTYVVVDCREGRNMIAINMDNDAWRNTDTAVKQLKNSLNELMKTKEVGFSIEIRPETLPRDFWDYNRYLIKEKKLKIRKLSIYLTNGLIDPRVEEIYKSHQFFKRILKEVFGAKQTRVDYIEPDGSQIVSRHGKTTLEQLAILITSEIAHGAFGLRVSYSNGPVVSCGEDVRAEFPMAYDTFLSMANTYLFGQSDIEWWLDGVVNEIKKLKDGTSAEKRTTRKRKRRVQEPSAVPSLF